VSDVRFYHQLLAGGRRIERFREAIERTVRPGDVVLDLGTGLGTFALFAARAGAARVWALDAEPVVHAARELARANGFGDVIRWVRGAAPEALPDETFDVILFEDYPIRLFDERVYRLMRAVLARLRPDGGRLLPGAARLVAAPVAGERLRRLLFPLEGAERGAFGLDWRCTRPYVANTPLATAVEPSEVAAEPVALGRVALHPLPACGDLGGGGETAASRSAALTGVALWFDLELDDDLLVSNAPDPGDEPWGPLVLPLDPPLPVEAGTALRLEVAYEPLADGAPGWLRWRVCAGGEERRGHEFAAYPAALADLYEQGGEGAAPERPKDPDP